MIETVGTKLRKARERRKLTLEDAARATKIRGRQLADLEADEYSNFPNLAYAKGFLVSYGKYLSVNVREHLDAFENLNNFGVDDYQYLSEVPLGVYRVSRRPTRRRKGKSRLVAMGSVLGMMMAAVVGWFLYVSFLRLGDLDKLAERQDAREHGVRADRPENGAREVRGDGSRTVPAAAPAFGAPLSAPPAPIIQPPVSSTPSFEDGGHAALALRPVADSSATSVANDSARNPAAPPVSVQPEEPGGVRILPAQPVTAEDTKSPGRRQRREINRGSVEAVHRGDARSGTAMNRWPE